MMKTPVSEKEKGESQKLENITKKEIQQQIFFKLEDLNDSQLLEEMYQKSVKHKNKEAYIEFYYSLFEN